MTCGSTGGGDGFDANVEKSPIVPLVSLSSFFFCAAVVDAPSDDNGGEEEVAFFTLNVDEGFEAAAASATGSLMAANDVWNTNRKIQ